ncbi:two-component system b [Gossypium arboreum]|uniref:Two-component system b n=1 Tax=Gossypium arboreum TaxID=29729 RepID=A0A0B0NIK7_GOSAR|nr:two-component system b [Gossypium arboreum]
MAPTLPSGDQASDQDNWYNGGLERKRQLVTEIVLRNRLTALVVDGDTMDAVDLIASGAKFNLIILEKILPVLNGLEVTRQNREIGVRCKMLAVTAWSGESEMQAFLAASVDVFIEKPLDPKHLVPILRELDGQ